MLLLIFVYIRPISLNSKIHSEKFNNIISNPLNTKWSYYSKKLIDKTELDMAKKDYQNTLKPNYSSIQTLNAKA